MKVVIEIPKDIYKEWKFDGKYRTHSYAQRLILDGTPLPEHHGRLIDADALLQEHRDIDAYPFPSTTIQNVPTIIEGSDSE